MKKTLFVLSVALVLLLTSGCSKGVSQQAYYALQNELNTVKAERDELLQYAPSETFKKVKEELGDTLPGMVFSEVNADEAKILQITAMASFDELSNITVKVGESFGEIISEMVTQSWFDYDYIYLDISAYGVGMLYSCAVDCSSLSMQSASWDDM